MNMQNIMAQAQRMQREITQKKRRVRKNDFCWKIRMGRNYL